MPRRPTKAVNVVAYDPGITTGWSVIEVSVEGITRQAPLRSIVKHGTFGEIVGNMQKQCNELTELMDWWPNAAVVGEDFTLRMYNQSKQFLSPVEINAVVKHHLGKKNRDLFLQQPSLAKSTISDDTLKEYGLYHRNSPHARDAVRHALTFLRRSAADVSLLERAWPYLFSAA